MLKRDVYLPTFLCYDYYKLFSATRVIAPPLSLSIFISTFVLNIVFKYYLYSLKNDREISKASEIVGRKT